VVETVACQDDVHRRAQQRDSLRSDRQVHGPRVGQEQAGVGETLGERLDPDAGLRRAGVREPERARADIHDDLSLEPVLVTQAGLVGDAPNLGSRLLPAPSVVGRSDGFPVEEGRDVAGIEAAASDHGVPGLQPPPELSLLLDPDWVS
jgi:hypothetical protein